MKKIELSKGEVALVDDEDYASLSRLAWHCHFSLQNGKKYAQHNYRDKGTTRCLKMHRVITNAPAGFDVDHIDGNGLNNQKSNLRIATRSLNRANSTKQKDNVSGYKGVTLNKGATKKQSWQASIKVNQKSIYLGCFYTIEEAARAYDKAARQYFGEFANLNFKD